MKFTSSILFAAIVAAAQFTSTFAVVYKNTAVEDEAETDGRPVIINVLDNDYVANDLDEEQVPINDEQEVSIVVLSLGVSTVTPSNGIATINTEGPGLPTIISTEGPGLPTITYTPNAGFVGIDRFGYTFQTEGSTATYDPSAEAVVTVTVTGVEDTVSIPFQSPESVSSEQAAAIVQTAAIALASSTPGGPDAEFLSNLFAAVNGGSAGLLAASAGFQQNGFTAPFPFP